MRVSTIRYLKVLVEQHATLSNFEACELLDELDREESKAIIREAHEPLVRADLTHGQLAHHEREGRIIPS